MLGLPQKLITRWTWSHQLTVVSGGVNADQYGQYESISEYEAKGNSAGHTALVASIKFLIQYIGMVQYVSNSDVSFVSSLTVQESPF